MLRNLNRSSAAGRICGIPYVGVLGSAVPATGTHGPGFMYESVIARPGYTNKRYRGRVTNIPASLTFNADENSAFVASGPDGIYVVTWEFSEFDGDSGAVIDTGETTITFGNGLVITGIVGNATANGLSASVSGVINCTVGTAIADGVTAALSGVGGIIDTISCSVGLAQAVGREAQIRGAGRSRAATMALFQRLHTQMLNKQMSILLDVPEEEEKKEPPKPTKKITKPALKTVTAEKPTIVTRTPKPGAVGATTLMAARNAPDTSQLMSQLTPLPDPIELEADDEDDEQVLTLYLKHRGVK